MSGDTPADFDEFQAALATKAGAMPKRLRQCARFATEHPERLAFATVAQIAEAAGVQPSAWMRFCRVMGFSGHSEMQRIFRERFAVQWPDYATRLRRLRDSGSDTPEALLGEFAEAGRQSLVRMTEQVAPERFREAARVLAGAGTIHLIGFGRAYPVAAYLAYALEKLGCANILHDGTGRLQRLSVVRPGDALVAISFAPYTQATLAFAREARGLGVRVIALTDSVLSPLRESANVMLEISELDVGAFRSLSATVALASALAVATGAERDRNRKKNVAMEKKWNKHSKNAGT